MKNKKLWLIISAVVSFVIIITAVIVSLTAGISLATDMGGGYQIEVQIKDGMSSKDAVDALKETLKGEHVSVERVFVEDKFIDKYVVAKTADKKLDVEALKTKITQRFDAEEGKVALHEIKGRITNNSVIWMSVGLVAVLIAIFVAMIFRYKIVSSAVAVLTLLHSLLFSAAMLIITRLPISLTSVIGLLAIQAFVLIALILYFERIRENLKMKHNEGRPVAEVASDSMKVAVKPLIYIAALIAILCVGFICIPVSAVEFIALSILVCLIVGIYSFYVIGALLEEGMLTFEAQNKRAALSKNVQPKKAKKK